MLLHGMLFVLSRVDQAESGKEKSDGQDDTNTKVDSPNAIAKVLLVCSKDNQSHHAGHDEAKVNREVGGNGSQDATAAADLGRLVGGFSRAGGASRVFA